MKISDFIFRFAGRPRTGEDSICRVRLFVSPQNRVVAVVTDLGDKNPGRAVTNAIERIAMALVHRGLIDADAQIVEHHEAFASHKATFALVSIAEDGSPNWNRMNIREAARYIGCTVTELSGKTEDDQRLYGEIERIRNAIDPFADSPYPEPPEVTVRRADIRSRMISKSDLSTLVHNNAGEQEIQRLLKRDLSVFGEVYAKPSEEYICFSEFPILDGFVDFVVFTGRSRMDVILIEVKGADFFFQTAGSYGKLSSNVLVAIQQIGSRIEQVSRNYDDFVHSAHRIRETAESGKSICNSLVGPQGALEVDPDKDVQLRTVVIGGRSRDDRKESKLRNQYENRHSPSIKIESWDSWMRKLERE